MKVTLQYGRFNVSNWDQYGPQPLPAVGDLVLAPTGNVGNGPWCKVRERRWVMDPNTGEDNVTIITEPPNAWGGPERGD